MNDAGGTSTFAYANHGQRNEQLDVVFVASAVLRYRRMFFVLMIAAVVCTLVLVLTQSRTWEATASFAPQTTDEFAASRLSSLAGQFGVELGGGGGAQSPQFYADLVKSSTILTELADDTVTIDGYKVAVADFASVSERNDLAIANAVEWLKHEVVSTSTSQETGVVRVTVRTANSTVSHFLANQILALINEFNLERRQSRAGQEREFVAARLREAEADLRRAENELQRFLQNNRSFQSSIELQFTHDRLQRRVGMQQQIYTSMVQSYEQARIDEVRNTPVITIIEAPEVPVEPESRRVALKMFLGLLIGLIAGLSQALIRDGVRRSKVREDVEFRDLRALWHETRGDLTGWRLLKRTTPEQ